MKRSKTQKGITLIALIITIIVLLILAAVSISAIKNDGLISYANQATNKHTQAQMNENAVIQNYSNKIEQHYNGSVGGNGSGSENDSNIDEDGYILITEATLQVGDYITYPVTYTNVETYHPTDETIVKTSNQTGWRVVVNYVDDNGNHIIKAMSAGTPETVAFDARTIRESDISGPYTINNAGETRTVYVVNSYNEYGKKYFNSEYGTAYGIFDAIDLNIAYNALGGCNNVVFLNESFYWINAYDKEDTTIYYADPTNTSSYHGTIESQTCGIRPVITLKTDLKVKQITNEDGTTYWDLKK